MKQFYYLRGAALALMAVFSFGSAQAATIDGVLDFGGSAVAIPGPGLNDAFALSFTNDFVVTGATGDFADQGLGFGSTGTMASLVIDPFTTVSPLLTIQFGVGVGKFAFTLETMEIVDQSHTFLVLIGCGTLTGTPDDLMPTQYNFAMSVDGQGGVLAYSGSLSPKVVPVPGALVLLASGLAALGFRRRG